MGVINNDNREHMEVCFFGCLDILNFAIGSGSIVSLMSEIDRLTERKDFLTLSFNYDYLASNSIAFSMTNYETKRLLSGLIKYDKNNNSWETHT
jgi:hypothetical protein